MSSAFRNPAIVAFWTTGLPSLIVSALICLELSDVNVPDLLLWFMLFWVVLGLVYTVVYKLKSGNSGPTSGVTNDPRFGYGHNSDQVADRGESSKPSRDQSR